jgi:CubicO group peptidase (beta-lactamase class C family)
MRFSRWLAAALLVWSCVLSPVLAAGSQFDGAKLNAIPQRMQELVDSQQISGAVVLIGTKDGGFQHLDAYGQSDIVAGRPMQPDAIFRIASMTKPITATALMQLVAAEKVNVDDPVAKYIPSFANQSVKEGGQTRPLGKPITIRQILTHTAGLANPRGPQTEGKSLAEIVDLIAAQPLAFEPGAKWQYSSGLTVAGRIVEVVSGQPFDQYLKARIFDPLGMTDTAFRLTPEQAARVAVTYHPGPLVATLEVAETPDPTADRTPNPSGGLYSTASAFSLPNRSGRCSRRKRPASSPASPPVMRGGWAGASSSIRRESRGCTAPAPTATAGPGGRRAGSIRSAVWCWS